MFLKNFTKKNKTAKATNEEEINIKTNEKVPKVVLGVSEVVLLRFFVEFVTNVADVKLVVFSCFKAVVLFDVSIFIVVVSAFCCFNK